MPTPQLKVRRISSMAMLPVPASQSNTGPCCQLLLSISACRSPCRTRGTFSLMPGFEQLHYRLDVYPGRRHQELERRCAINVVAAGNFQHFAN